MRTGTCAIPLTPRAGSGGYPQPGRQGHPTSCWPGCRSSSRWPKPRRLREPHLSRPSLPLPPSMRLKPPPISSGASCRWLAWASATPGRRYSGGPGHPVSLTGPRRLRLSAAGGGALADLFDVSDDASTSAYRSSRSTPAFRPPGGCTRRWSATGCSTGSRHPAWQLHEGAQAGDVEGLHHHVVPAGGDGGVPPSRPAGGRIRRVRREEAAPGRMERIEDRSPDTGTKSDTGSSTKSASSANPNRNWYIQATKPVPSVPASKSA
jgi:hypothetical protein